MESTQTRQPKKIAKREVSSMRKITIELDAEVRKVEVIKGKIAKLEKSALAANDRIKSLMAQLSKNITN